MFEKEAEEIAKDIYIHHFDDNVIYPNVLKAITVGAQKGAEFGFQECAKSRLNITSISDCPIKEDKLQWHDLEKDPNDLPKDYKTMCICLGDFGSQYQPVPRVCVGYYDSLGWSDYMGSSLYSTVRYWCELPKFKE